MEDKSISIELTGGEMRYLLKKISVVIDRLEQSNEENNKEYQICDAIFDKLADGLEQLSHENYWFNSYF